jgi:hypothetical protein
MLLHGSLIPSARYIPEICRLTPGKSWLPCGNYAGLEIAGFADENRATNHPFTIITNISFA